MDLWATKTPYERQQEEDERLVRPNPSDKPPRRDLRRERVQPERDPDSGDSSDQKDRSHNYKNIGGSVVTATKDRIPAKNRATGETVMISPDTLKEKPGEYEPVDQEAPKEEPKESEPASEEKSPSSSKPEKLDREQYYAQAGTALLELAKSDLKLDNKLKNFMSPGSQLSGMTKENPDFPASTVFPGVKLPDGIRTLGDLKYALEFASKAKGKVKTKKKVPPPSSEDPSTPESAATPSSEPGSEAKPSEPAPESDAPPETKPSEKLTEPPATEAPKAEGEAPKPEEKPKKKPRKPKTPGREPSEAEKAGIGEPKRRPVTSLEREEALSLVTSTFTPDVAAGLLAKNLHPDDLKTVVRDYHSAKLGVKFSNAADLAAKASSFYQLDPSKVKPPSFGKNAAGETVAFDKLTPEEKAEVTRHHQLRIAAMSIAARDLLTQKLVDQGPLTGKPRIPPKLASQMATMMLQRVPPEQAEALAAKTFDETLKSGSATKIGDSAARRFLKQISGDPVATATAKAFMQANDYGLAKERFLKGDDDSISEWQTSGSIIRGLRRAGEYFDRKNELYGGEPEHPAASAFRLRILNRLRTLDPEKASAVTKELPKLEEEEFRKHHKYWKELHQEWEARKAKHEAGSEGKAFSEVPPHEPQKPVGRPDPKEGETMWDEVSLELKEPPKPEKRPKKKPPGKKEASDFTYLAPLVMGSADKTGVYHGVDPYAYGPAAYPGWLQPHQRDFGESDFDVILSSANDWLSSPLLMMAVDGLVPDARLRAALDLAIYAGPYNGQIQPTVYNMLLSRLGKPPAKSVAAREKTAGHSYETERMTLLIYGKHPFNVDVKDELYQARFPYKDDEGNSQDGGNVSILDIKSGPSPSYLEEKKGLVQESVVTVDLPKGAGKAALQAIQSALKPLRIKVEKASPGHKPELRKMASDDTSTFTPSPSDPTGGSTLMKASQEIYRIASTLAETHSKASFDLLAVAERVAEDEKKMPPWLEKKIEDKEDKGEEKKEASANKYASLRSLIIRQASTLAPEQRGPLLPILQALKDLG